EAGLAGGVGQRAQVDGGVSLEGAVGGPVQAGVAVPLPLAGEPAGQDVQVPVRGRAGISALPLRLGGQRAAGVLPAQGAVAGGGSPRQVGVAVDLGGRGQDVAAGRAEVHVVGGQVAPVLGGAGEVDVHAAAGGADVAVRVLEQPGAVEPAEGGVPVPG